MHLVENKYRYRMGKGNKSRLTVDCLRSLPVLFGSRFVDC